jgi:hypothetical protein
MSKNISTIQISGLDPHTSSNFIWPKKGYVIHEFFIFKKRGIS